MIDVIRGGQATYFLNSGQLTRVKKIGGLLTPRFNDKKCVRGGEKLTRGHFLKLVLNCLY